MLQNIVFSLRFARRSFLLPLAIVCAAACGSESGGPGAGGGGGDGGVAGDGGENNPQNPAGLGPAPVDLGSTSDLAAAGSYVLLAKTGITNVTGSAITGGHVGISPEFSTAITGFSEIADASGTFSTSASVVSPGRIYAADYTTPTPSNLTVAVLDMEAAYADAAGRSDPDFLNLASGEIGGETLVPGLYTFGSSVTIPSELTLSGGANDVWIFQISGDLDLSTNQQVTLSGGAVPENVFWQVAGEVVIHADAHFEGNILCMTQVTLQTNATMDGRVYAQSLIALDDNDIAAP